jgi:hypothetical protein
VRDRQQRRLAAVERERARALPHLGHPRAAALLGRARKGVDENVRGGLAGALDLEELDGRVPHLRADGRRLHLADRHAEEVLDEREEAREHAVKREELAHRLLVKIVRAHLELLRPVGDVPLAQGLGLCAGALGAREGLERRVLGARGLERLFAELVEERARAVDRRHLARDGDLGVGAAAEEAGALGAQRQDLRDQRAVVLRRARLGRHVGRELGRARDVGAVHVLAEGAVVGEAEHGEHAGRIEGDDPRPGLR